MSARDWDLKPQVFNLSKPQNKGPPRKVTEAQAAKTIQAGGNVLVEKRIVTNQKNNIGKAAKLLDDDHENLSHKTVDFNLRASIQKYRQQKGMTQQQLATAISERASVVTEYENGKAIPNESVLQRMEKALGVHLRGVNKGQPFGAKPAAKPAPKPAPKVLAQKK